MRTYHSTPEQLAAGGTFVASPGVVWDGDDVDHAIKKADWGRLEATVAARTISGRGPSYPEKHREWAVGVALFQRARPFMRRRARETFHDASKRGLWIR
jgi:hypothetical protein